MIFYFSAHYLYDYSDDRTSSALKSKVTAAIEAQMGKPNLVVIDEIDGASASGSGDNTFINLLVQLVQGNNAKRKGKKNKKKKELLRPIICICNDPYAPVFRPLLQVAHHVIFKKPAYNELSKRLHDLCKWEGVGVRVYKLSCLCANWPKAI